MNTPLCLFVSICLSDVLIFKFTYLRNCVYTKLYVNYGRWIQKSFQSAYKQTQVVESAAQTSGDYVTVVGWFFVVCCVVLVLLSPAVASHHSRRVASSRLIFHTFVVRTVVHGRIIFNGRRVVGVRL